ncbi:MAG: hypothetical protein R3C52_00490 [Hyphomonadaceae bacterium]
MDKRLVSIVCVAICATATAFGAPAFACRAAFMERYLVWPDTPPLEPDEVAIEIDARDFADNYGHRDLGLPVYKVKTVLAGQYDQDSIAVRRTWSSCEQEMAPGTFTRLVLVGKLRDLPSGGAELIPRFMRYDDPLHVEADEPSSEEAPRR